MGRRAAEVLRDDEVLRARGRELAGGRAGGGRGAGGRAAGGGGRQLDLDRGILFLHLFCVSKVVYDTRHQHDVKWRLTVKLVL